VNRLEGWYEAKSWGLLLGESLRERNVGFWLTAEVPAEIPERFGQMTGFDTKQP